MSSHDYRSIESGPVQLNEIVKSLSTERGFYTYSAEHLWLEAVGTCTYSVEVERLVMSIIDDMFTPGVRKQKLSIDHLRAALNEYVGELQAA